LTLSKDCEKKDSTKAERPLSESTRQPFNATKKLRSYQQKSLTASKKNEKKDSTKGRKPKTLTRIGERQASRTSRERLAARQSGNALKSFLSAKRKLFGLIENRIAS
jgi:hypothetical protein